MTYLQDFHQVKTSTQGSHSSIWYLIEDAQRQESSGKGSINTRVYSGHQTRVLSLSRTEIRDHIWETLKSLRGSFKDINHLQITHMTRSTRHHTSIQSL